MTSHATGKVVDRPAGPASRRSDRARARGRSRRVPDGILTKSRPLPDSAQELRATIAGFGVGGFVIAAMIVGSTALALLASLAAIATSVVSPMAGMVGLALAAPIARPLVIPPPGFYFVMAAAILFGVVLRLPIERPRLGLPAAPVLLLGAFVVYAVAHYVGGGIDGLPSASDRAAQRLVARLAESAAVFGVAYIVLRGRSPYPVLTALLASAALAAVAALGEPLGVESLFANLVEEVGNRQRVTGVFDNPNYFGAYVASMIALAVALAVEAPSRRARFLLLPLIALLAVALLNSQSRAALLAVAAGLVTIAFVRSFRTGVLTIALTALVATLAYPAFAAWRFGGEDPNLASASGRTDLWAEGFEAFASSPLVGVGLGRFADETTIGLTAHNWFVQVLAELGITGIMLWALFIGATILALKGRPRPARAAGYAVLVVWLVASMSMAPPSTFRFTGPVLLVVAAASVALWPEGRGPAGPGRWLPAVPDAGASRGGQRRRSTRKR